jgi:hypothetical protein
MKNVKKLALALIMMAVMPLAMNAQPDGFFRGGGENYDNRDVDGVTIGSMNNENPTPVGSGLMVMVAAGAGYVLLKKKED